jgi:NAD-dependent deacetylase
MAKKLKLVILTGAGISAESGLKTFRDSDGLWENYSVYDVATPGAFAKNPQMVLEFYNARRKDVAAAQPNLAHKELAKLEKKFDVTIITQNIDNLHERAGSTNVLHLHGEIFKMRSVYNNQAIFDCPSDINVGNLAKDGGQLRPHIVWFEEQVPMMATAVNVVEQANIFVVIGTSLQVYPAASLIDYVPPYCPKFILDTNIPETSYNDIITIEAPATHGIVELVAAVTAIANNKK